MTITGTISWPLAPKPAPVVVTRDRHVCGAAGMVRAPAVSIDDKGGLAGAVVFVESRDGGPVQGPASRPASVEFDQHNCMFTPYVAATRLGASVSFRNSDPVLHNVHATMGEDTLANYAMPVQGQVVKAFVARKAGIVHLRCDAGHSWMSAHLMVLDHSLFAMTDGAGRFSISSLPKGALRLVAWHPDAGRTSADIDVKGGDGPLAVKLVFDDAR